MLLVGSALVFVWIAVDYYPLVQVPCRTARVTIDGSPCPDCGVYRSLADGVAAGYLLVCRNDEQYFVKPRAGFVSLPVGQWTAARSLAVISTTRQILGVHMSPINEKTHKDPALSVTADGFGFTDMHGRRVVVAGL